MRPVLIILSVSFFACQSKDKVTKPLSKRLTIDTVLSLEQYRHFKEGLYMNATGDIGIKTFEKIGNDTLLERYITRVYNGKEEADGGPHYLKNAVDTITFQSLEDGYYKDKRNVYFRFSTSDGGALKVIDKADPKSFKSVGKNELALDKFAFYRHGERITKREFYYYRDELSR